MDAKLSAAGDGQCQVAIMLPAVPILPLYPFLMPLQTLAAELPTNDH